MSDCEIISAKESPRRGRLNISSDDVAIDPYPLIIAEEFLQPDFYERLRKEFPADSVFDKNATLGGRAGRDLYRGDPAYEELMNQSAAWREFHEYINSPAYINFTLELFGAQLLRVGCQVDASKARFTDYVEERAILADKSRLRTMRSEVLQKLHGSKNKDDLFVRLDLAQASVGYEKPVHCDRPNRLTSMLVYFCDADEIGMQGGDLLIHEHNKKNSYQGYERHPKPENTHVVKRLRPKHNLGVFFICCNNSYHSATAVTAQRGYRNFFYISVSSRAHSIW